MLWKSKYDLKNFQKNLHNTIFFKYKTVLCKFSWTTSKIRAMGNRAIENRVRRGMPVSLKITYKLGIVTKILVHSTHYSVKFRLTESFTNQGYYFGDGCNKSSIPELWLYC